VGDGNRRNIGTFEFVLAVFRGDEGEEREKRAEPHKRQFDKAMGLGRMPEVIGTFKLKRQER
jgi:hypothetical protein